jgi:microcystin degradation protein MlrC
VARPLAWSLDRAFRLIGAKEPPLLSMARRLEAAHPGSDIALLGGFPYADTPYCDAGVMTWAADAACSWGCWCW